MLFFFDYKLKTINVDPKKAQLINAYWFYLQTNVIPKIQNYTVVSIRNNERLHAETNLVYNLYKMGLSIKRNDYISISGECCPLCAAFLKSWYLRFYGRKQNIMSSFGWNMPNGNIPTKVYKKFVDNLEYINTLFTFSDKLPRLMSEIEYTMDEFPEDNALVNNNT